ncbi:N-(5'-phosphoribosyl)anthranilate isomerase [Microbulbifer agarilyticus]|uniref:N-(5'-phosphoribosyl)anthranilate isomerase n=1 Tax=Microbulbifer agarilyticus TaxID=260552 RepID=A0A1Q2M646_9GAMM|nr:phosphoribosylanthranilate isomerase [Microbulbifer agarilyticus]AQQ68213.1 N-(5'-phosphoribosyl)anthranilate isomerase [Microbulbifer agarilyticus]
MRVKICGITSVEDARLAVDAGADALGMVFYPPSPRHVSLEQAAEIARAVTPFVVLTGLFVDAHPQEVEQVLAQVPLNLLQFHGNETAAYCRQFHRPYIKALRMKPELNPSEAMSAYPDARGYLLDAYRKGVPGGTGDTFDWQRVPQGRERNDRQVILAGGLNPANVTQAISAAVPDAVDVSGGVEAAPGRKDPDKVREFVRAARAAATSGASSNALIQGV